MLTQALAKKMTDLKMRLYQYDSYTALHSINVGYYSYVLGEKMDLSHERLENLFLGGVFHDVGKICIPKYIINKAGPLTNKEYKKIKLHPVYGARILKDIGITDGLPSMVLSHHERFNGTGYPFRLVNDEIPLESRIISVVDTFDAMTSDRVYKKAISIDAALDQLRKEAGILFDPSVIDVLLRNYSCFKYAENMGICNVYGGVVVDETEK